MSAAALVCVLPLLGLSAEEPSAAFLDDYNACGPVCLYAVARLKGRDVDFDHVKELAGPPRAGVHSLADIANAACGLGLFPVAVRADRAGLGRLPLPAIAHLKRSLFMQGPQQSHFVVLLASTETGVLILDPPFAAASVGRERFAEAWTGNLLLFADSAQEARRWRAGLESPTEHQLNRWLPPSGGLLLVVVLVTIQWARLRTFARKVLRSSAGVMGGLTQKLIWSAAGPRPEETTPGRSATRTALCVLVVLVAGASAIVVAASIVRSGKAPVLETPGDVVDLGEVGAPGTSRAAVPICNSGGRALVIDRVASSCGCAVAQIPSAIPPGESADLAVSLAVSPGVRSADLLLYSNDPEGPHRLALRWHGAAKPMLLPPRISAVGLPPHSTYQRTVHVVYPGGESATVPELLKMECDAPEVHVRVGKNNPRAFRAARSSLSRMGTIGYLDLDVRVQPPAKGETVDTSCRITIRYGKTQRVLSLPLRVSFLGTTRVQPERILFSARRASALVGQERRVKLSIDPNATTREPEVKEYPRWLACEVVPSSAGEYDLRTRVLTVPATLRASGKILLQWGGSAGTKTSVGVLTFALRD